MHFPLGFDELSIWLAETAITLLATSEIISYYFGERYLIIEKGRLKNIAVILGILFILTVSIRVFRVIQTL